MAFAEGVANLANHGSRPAVAVFAVPDAQRVEYPAHDSGKTQQTDSQFASLDSRSAQHVIRPVADGGEIRRQDNGKICPIFAVHRIASQHIINDQQFARFNRVDHIGRAAKQARVEPAHDLSQAPIRFRGARILCGKKIAKAGGTNIVGADPATKTLRMLA